MHLSESQAGEPYRHTRCWACEPEDFGGQEQGAMCAATSFFDDLSAEFEEYKQSAADAEVRGLPSPSPSHAR